MDSLDNELNLQAETRQMQKLQMYQKLGLFTLLKFKWSILAVFSAAILIAAGLRYVQFQRSHHKFEGSVTLFYTPRASEEVKPLSLNQVLGIFSRQQIFQQVSEKLHLTDQQKSYLKQSIEVKLLRDQNDMFVIIGSGDTDAYVKELVNTFVSLSISNYEKYRENELLSFLEAREKRLTEVQGFLNAQIKKTHDLHKKYEIIHPEEEMETVKKMQGEQAATLAELNVKLTDANRRFLVAEKNYKAIPENVIKHRGTLREFVSDTRRALREYEKAKLMFAERNPRYVEAKSAYEAIAKEFTAFKEHHKITEFEECMLLDIEGHINRYQEAEAQLQQITLSMKALQAEMELVRKKEHDLQQMIPEHEQVQQLRKTASKNISLLVEELTRVRSNLAHVKSDITINERLVNTKAFSCFPVKMLAVILIAGIFAAGLYAVVRVGYDIIFGKFSGIEEAAFHKDFFNTVGVIPSEEANFTAEQRQVLNNEMFYRFILRLKDARTIFSCSLDGSFLSSVMFDEQFTKAKRNTILVRLIHERDQERICGKMQKIGHFYYSDNGNIGVNFTEKEIQHNIDYLQGFSTGDGKGYGYGYGFAFFPVRNLSVLEPDEISTLYEIVTELKNHYQLIRISREKSFDASCALVRQLHDICDATLLYIGKKKTARSVLRRILRLHDDEHKIYAILTGVTDVNKVVSGDYI